MGLRIAGIVVALALGVGPLLFLLGPVLFENMPLSAISPPARAASIGFGVFGAWLFLVSCVAPSDDLKRVLEPFGATETVVLFLPYMLFIGSRSIWRSIWRRTSHEEP